MQTAESEDTHTVHNMFIYHVMKVLKPVWNWRVIF